MIGKQPGDDSKAADGGLGRELSRRFAMLTMKPCIS